MHRDFSLQDKQSGGVPWQKASLQQQRTLHVITAREIHTLCLRSRLQCRPEHFSDSTQDASFQSKRLCRELRFVRPTVLSEVWAFDGNSSYSYSLSDDFMVDTRDKSVQP